MIQAADAPDREPVLVSIALAPLRAIERTRGWRRLGVLVVYGMIALAASAALWRQAQLRELPDVGVPFDVAAFRASSDSPEGRDALASYRRAADQYVEMSPAVSESYTNAYFDWSKADAILLAWLERNEEAIALLVEGSRCGEPAVGWREGASVQDAVLENGLIGSKLDGVGQAARSKARRLLAQGDLAGAWALLNASVRASRHMEWIAPVALCRVGGVMRLHAAAQAIAEWAADPSVDVALLRQALDDLDAAEALTPPLSVTYKTEHLIAQEAMGRASVSFPRPTHPNLIVDLGLAFAERSGLGPYLEGEPERSRRVLNLLAANDLAWCDRPDADRPGFAIPRLRIYKRTPGASTAPLPLAPQDLAAWADSSRHARRLPWRADDLELAVYAGRGAMRRLSGRVASALFFKETGRRPSSSGEALLRYRPEPGDAPDRDEAEPLP